MKAFKDNDTGYISLYSEIFPSIDFLYCGLALHLYCNWATQVLQSCHTMKTDTHSSLPCFFLFFKLLLSNLSTTLSLISFIMYSPLTDLMTMLCQKPIAIQKMYSPFLPELHFSSHFTVRQGHMTNLTKSVSGSDMCQLSLGHWRQSMAPTYSFLCSC